MEIANFFVNLELEIIYFALLKDLIILLFKLVSLGWLISFECIRQKVGIFSI